MRRPGARRLARLAALASLAMLAAGPTAACGAGGQEPPVRPGIQVLLADSLHLVEGRRVGLVTNHTGIAPSPAAGASTEADPAIPSRPEAHPVRSSIDLLWEHPGVELVALYSPEHGIRGTAEAGERVAGGTDERTGLPIHSLYGDTRKPTPEMLRGVEVLLFDIQDIGTRYYTYIYTMALAMEAAGEEDIPFVVLDRPNPIGGLLVQGNVLDPAFSTFVGMYPIPMRHGMTPGELALLFRDRFGVAAELQVVPAEGWRRDMLFPETGLPWVAPSPNMPDLESALHYPGTCLFEGTNLSVGRGTDRAFQWVGAPWLDGEELARRMEARGLPGIRFEAARFTPRNPGDGKFADVEVEGVRLIVEDPAAYDPALAGVALLLETRDMSGDRWRWHGAHFDRLAGTDTLRPGIDEGLGMDELTADWSPSVDGFLRIREAALIYR